METNWYTSVAGIVGVTIFLVGVMKKLFGNVAYVNTVPTWLYAVAISAGLTTLANYIWHTLPGNLWQNMMQAVMMAGSASGFYEWWNARTKPLAASAISAGVTVEEKNAPDRVDTRAVLPTPKTLTVLFLVALLSVPGCASRARHVATVTVVTADSVLSAIQDTEMGLVCGKSTAPAPPACVPIERHREISDKLVTAFSYDKRIATAVKALPPGAASADVAELLGQLQGLVDAVLALIPQSPQRQTLLTHLGGK
jgi:hypothetical protein